MSKKSIDLSKTKINYLAIGDSIAEGFNPLYRVGFPGEMKIKKNKEKMISGMSYPSYFANLINMVNPDILESFDNFAITGTRITDWLYFLGVKPAKYNYLNSKMQIKAAKKLDVKENNPWKKRVQNQFGEFGLKSKNDFDKLKVKIKEANLITITIGANDLLTRVPLLEIISWQNNKITTKELNEVFEKLINEVLKNLITLLKTIHKLNPNAKIIVTSYPNILSKFFDLIDEKLGRDRGYPDGLIHHCVKLLNNSIVNAANAAEVHYLNIENNEYWKENIDHLSTVFFEIHPTTHGYKNMGYELFFKTSLSNNFYNKDIDEIKKKFPNITTKFLNNNDVILYNVLDFSKIKLTDNKIIKLSKIDNEDYFWTNIKQQKQFLSLQRELSAKSYLNNGFKLLTENSENSFSSLLVMTNLNSVISDEILAKILNNKKYFIFLSKILIKSDYLDNVINQIQQELNSHYFSKNNTKVDLITFEKIIFNKILNIQNVLFLLKDIGIELSNLTNKNLLNSFKELTTLLLVNFNKLNSYKEMSITFIKKEFINMISKKNKNINANLLGSLIDNFIEIKGYDFFIDNLIKSYFKVISEIKNLKNIYIFSEKYVEEFLKNINIDTIIKNILKNPKIQNIISEILISILEIENSSKKDNIKIKNTFILFISNIKNKELAINILSKIFLFLINKTEKKSFQLLDFKNNEFWNIFKNSKIKKILIHKKDYFVLSNVINLIFEKTKINGEIWNNLKNIKNPKLNKSRPILNVISVGQDLISKTNKIERFYLIIVNTLYNEFLEFKKINPMVKNEDNPCYHALYRIVISSLWVGYRMFQKDVPINIFWNTKKGISQSLPSIANEIYSLSMGKTINLARQTLIDYIFGNVTIQFGFDPISNDNYLTESILWYIKTCDKNKIDKHSGKPKEDVIFESLRIGYWKNK